MNDKTELVVILDRSGSMQTNKSDHEGGLRSFVQDQRNLAGDVRLTLVLFDGNDPFELVYDAMPLDRVDEGKLELIPRGSTPLLDAVGRTISHVSARQERTWRPDATIVIVITDGEENASKEFTKGGVKRLIAEREAKDWKILYLGANVDAFAEAGQMGMAVGATSSYAAAPANIAAMYGSLTSNTMAARGMSARGGDWVQTLNWTEEQRTAMQEEEDNP